MTPNYKKGIYLAILTAVISGFSIFINKLAVDSIKPALVFTATKNFGVGFFIISLVLITGKWQQIKKVTKKELAQLILIGIIGGSLPFYLFFTGLSQSSAINSAMIHKSLIFWVALLAIPFLKEKLSRIQALAVSILFISNYFVGGFSGFQFGRGEELILLATILWAIENVIAKKVLPHIDPDLVTAFRMGLGSLILIIASVVIYPAALSKTLSLTTLQYFWLFLTMTSLLAYVMTWYRALKYAPAIIVTAILVSSTLITNVLSAIFITHAWTITLSLQSLAMLLGIVFLILFSSKTKDFSLQAK